MPRYLTVLSSLVWPCPTKLPVIHAVCAEQHDASHVVASIVRVFGTGLTTDARSRLEGTITSSRSKAYTSKPFIDYFKARPYLVQSRTPYRGAPCCKLECPFRGNQGWLEREHGSWLTSQRLEWIGSTYCDTDVSRRNSHAPYNQQLTQSLEISLVAATSLSDS
jgi:hypothetical protein